MAFETNALTKLAGFDELFANGCGHNPDFLMRGTNHENAALLPVCVPFRVSLGIRLLNRFCPISPGDFANRPDLFEFVEAPLRRSAQLLNGFAIIHYSLSLNLGEGTTLQTRFGLINDKHATAKAPLCLLI